MVIFGDLPTWGHVLWTFLWTLSERPAGALASYGGLWLLKVNMEPPYEPYANDQFCRGEGCGLKVATSKNHWLSESTRPYKFKMGSKAGFQWESKIPNTVSSAG